MTVLTGTRVRALFCSIIISILASAVCAGSGRGDYHVTYDGQSIDNLIINYMEANNIPGLSLAIVQAPYITRVVGYGVADQQKGTLVATRTMFDIGQITNAFTAVAIMQLKEEQKLNLDDSISKFIPDAPKSWQSITIRDLMVHSSGIPSYTDAANFDYSQTHSVPEIINAVKDKPLLFEPGSQVRPSATEGYLLGLIVEKASGMSYQDYVTKNQIERVGLKNTFVMANLSQVRNELNNGTNPFKHSLFLQDPIYINPTELAAGYREENGKLVPVKPNDWTASYANSGIVASAEDISTWDISLAGSILLKDPKDREFLYQAVTLKNKDVIPGNVGWFFPGHKGLMEIKGNVPGFSSFLSRFTAPTELLCVTLLANKEGLPDLDILGRKIAGAFDGKLAAPKGAPWSETVESPYPVTQTIDRVAAIVKAHGGKVFARINQSLEAANANQTLPATEVLIIGNPAKGTALMQANAAMALDLPLRVMATVDANGQVWLSFTDPVALGRAYQLDPSQSALLKQMSQALRQVVEKAVSPNHLK